jgi:hypothetical protein
MTREHVTQDIKDAKVSPAPTKASRRGSTWRTLGKLPAMSRLLAFSLLLGALPAKTVFAAQGEKGTGIPEFGTYAAQVGGYTAVFALTNASIPFPAGCTGLYLYTSVFGVEAYKIALATLLAAKVSGRRVRFYSHSESGCQVDYVQILD